MESQGNESCCGIGPKQQKAGFWIWRVYIQEVQDLLVVSNHLASCPMFSTITFTFRAGKQMKSNVLWSVFHLVLLSYFMESLVFSTFKTWLRHKVLQNKQKNRIKNIECYHAFILNLIVNFSFEIFFFVIVIETAKMLHFLGAKSSLLKRVSSLSLCREYSLSVL